MTSSTSPQRCLNRQSIYPPFSNQINFINSLRFSQVCSILQKNLPICQKCKLKLKNHYCMEPLCHRKKLLCINCDIKSIKGQHYLHDFTYLVPLFSESLFENFNKLKDDFSNFNQCICLEIQKIKDYLKKLQKIQKLCQKQMSNLENYEKVGKFKQFSKNIGNYIDQLKQKKIQQTKGKHTFIEESSLDKIFKDIHFISGQQCSQKQQKLKKQLLDQIQKLNWIQNPQKIMSDLLKQQGILNNTLTNEQQRDIFISSKKKISINQIDHFFRNYNQLFTQNLQYHKVQLKIEPQLLNKSKFYEAFIYHFKDCEKLLIDNANITHLRTPLNFRKLKELQFNCNVETDTLSTSRLQNQNEELQAFTIRKFREEDIKMLKFITGSCKKLKSLHIQFFNKSDLCHSKQLIEYLNQQSQKDLNKFVLKIRTQNQVKRLYGYLSKFYREASQPSLNLSQAILDLLNKNDNLTKIVIEGIKNLDSQQILKKLFEMKFLMQYKIYFQNIDLMTQLDNELSKILQIKSEKKRRLFASLTKMSKDKDYPPQILHTIGQQFLI